MRAGAYEFKLNIFIDNIAKNHSEFTETSVYIFKVLLIFLMLI